MIDQNAMDTAGKGMPFFTVCIPVYNTAQYVSSCVDSVLGQSEQDMEIVLVDDGSTDGSGALCDEYARNYPQTVRVLHKENEGLLLARYDAVRLARGRFLMFLDSDDFYYPETLKTVREALEQYRADMVIFDWQRVYPDQHTRRETCAYPDRTVFEGEGKQQLYVDLITGNRINSVCKKCIAREVYDTDTDYRLYKGLTQAEDKFISFPCLDRSTRVVYLKAPLYGYRMNEASVTYNFSLKQYKDIQVVVGREDEYIRRWGIPEEIKTKKQVHRLETGINCVVSTIGLAEKGKIDTTAVEEAVDYVAAQYHASSSFDAHRKMLPWYYRDLCKYIACRDMRGIRRARRRVERLRRIKRRIAGLWRRSGKK